MNAGGYDERHCRGTVVICLKLIPDEDRHRLRSSLYQGVLGNVMVLEIVRLTPAARLLRAFIPTGVSFMSMLVSVERYQRRVVVAEAPTPVLLTVAVRVILLEDATKVPSWYMLTIRSGGVAISTILVKIELSEFVFINSRPS